jgi:hypothetical protein
MPEFSLVSSSSEAPLEDGTSNAVQALLRRIQIFLFQFGLDQNMAQVEFFSAFCLELNNMVPKLRAEGFGNFTNLQVVGNRVKLLDKLSALNAFVFAAVPVGSGIFRIQNGHGGKTRTV